MADAVSRNISKQIHALALNNSVDYFGIADLKQTYHSICEQGGEYVASFPYSISLGISLLDSIVDLLPRPGEMLVRVSYRHYVYDIINLRLDLSASYISSYLQKLGYRSFPIPASKRVDEDRICAAFSHKLGAHIAGLGWIGKSCLLITPDRGPRVRWATVLTDAPLKATGSNIDEQCGNCTKCIDICPVKAFTGRPFRKGEPREVRYNALACERHLRSMEKDTQIAVCGLCLYVCPFGQTKKSEC
jgi:epoxyqueuosine reductase